MAGISFPGFGLLFLLMVLESHVKAEWIIPPVKVKENEDYSSKNPIAKIRSDVPGVVRYEIVGEGADQKPYHLFTINPDNGEISITAIVDREEKAIYELKGRAYNSAGKQVESNIDLKIKIEDVNDNSPRFTQRTFSGSVYELICEIDLLNVTAVSRERLIAASRQYLRTGKKGLPAAASLNLAAQVLAVDAGLKPALLYDCNTAGAEQVRPYLQTLLDTGFLNQPPYVLDIDGSVLIINTQRTIRRLENIPLKKQVTIMDVSRCRGQPAVADAGVRRAVEGRVTVFVDYLKNLNWDDKLGVAPSARLAEELTSRWNLCTLFGLLLGYPAAYWFDNERSFENCLSMTPLRVTSVSAACPLITGGASGPAVLVHYPQGSWDGDAGLNGHLDPGSRRPVPTAVRFYTPEHQY
ncbi:UNVERIFIED_CONTAM: hypothetical protein FKN15_035732 [Acipenser sinensis]